jgi:uncharacterized membrane protein
MARARSGRDAGWAGRGATGPVLGLLAGGLVVGGLVALAGYGRGASLQPQGGLGAAVGRGAARVLPTRTVKIRRSVTVGRPREEVWPFVRDLANFPRFAWHVESVTPLGHGRSRWVVRGPGGSRLAWDAVIEAEVENERLSWTSVEGADIRNAGVLGLRDAPGGRGTEVHLRLAYDAPGGKAGQLLAWLFGEEPDVQARDDLGRLKALLETGEMPTNALRRADAGREAF